MEQPTPVADEVAEVVQDAEVVEDAEVAQADDVANVQEADVRRSGRRGGRGRASARGPRGRPQPRGAGAGRGARPRSAAGRRTGVSTWSSSPARPASPLHRSPRQQGELPGRLGRRAGGDRPRRGPPRWAPLDPSGLSLGLLLATILPAAAGRRCGGLALATDRGAIDLAPAKESHDDRPPPSSRCWPPCRSTRAMPRTDPAPAGRPDASSTRRRAAARLSRRGSPSRPPAPPARSTAWGSKDGALQIPPPGRAGWFDAGPRPGELGRVGDREPRGHQGGTGALLQPAEAPARQPHRRPRPARSRAPLRGGAQAPGGQEALRAVGGLRRRGPSRPWC